MIQTSKIDVMLRSSWEISFYHVLRDLSRKDWNRRQDRSMKKPLPSIATKFEASVIFFKFGWCFVSYLSIAVTIQVDEEENIILLYFHESKGKGLEKNAFILN